MVQFLSQPVSSENTVAHSQQCLRTHHTISTYKFSILIWIHFLKDSVERI